MSLITNAPIPAQDPIAQPRRAQFGPRPDPLEGMLTPPWLDWFSNLVAINGSTPRNLNVVEIRNSGASAGPTDLGNGNLSEGLYEIQWYAQIVRPGGVSSTLTVGFSWSTNAVTQSFVGAAITGNTTDTNQGDTRLLVRVDATSPILLSTIYGSVGAPTMLYDLDVCLTKVDA